MSDPCCPFIKPDGQPCAAHPLSGRPFCLFHDPDQAARLAEARSKGGSTPRRRLRRFPRLLDHVHVAELLGELFVDSLNNPDAIDTKRLQALTALSRALLKAVGTPPTFLVHSDRREPSPAAGHLLRVYPPLPPEVEALLAAEPPATGDLQPPPPADAPLQELDTVDAGDGDAWYGAARFLPSAQTAAPPSAPPPLACNRPIPTTATSDPSNRSDPSDPSNPPLATAPPPQGLPEAEQEMEQALNRARTGGSSCTEKYWDLLLASLPSSPPPAQPAPEVRDAPVDQPAPHAVPLGTTPTAHAVASPEHPNTRTPEHPG